VHASGQGKGPVPAAERRLALVGALLAVVPIAVALVAELLSSTSRPLATSDLAVLELHTMHASRGAHLLGPYSQYLWNHPGPLYYYLLAPGHLLSGQSSASLSVTATLLNAAAIGAMLWTYGKLEQRLLVRLAFGALLVAFIADFALLQQPTALTSPWNPIVTVLPFGAFLLLAALTATGRLAALPATVLVHAFLCQTHVAYGPTATVVLCGALALCYRRRGTGVGAPSRRTERRTVVVTAGLATAAWLPPIIGELVAETSNARLLLRHFLAEQSLVFDWREGIAYAATQFAAPLLRALKAAGAGGAITLVALALLLLQLGLLALAAGRHLRGPRRAAGTLALLCGSAMVAATWSCRYVGNIGGQLHPYLTHWLALLSIVGWAAIVSALAPTFDGADSAPRAAEHERRRTMAYWLLSITAFLATSACAVVVRGYRAPAQPSAQARATRAIVRQCTELSRVAGGGRPVMRLEEHRAWPVLAGVVLALEKQGVEPILDRRFRFIFGAGRSYLDPASQPDRGLFMSLERRHDKPLWARHDPVFLYAPPTVAAGRALAADSDHPAADGITPPDGTPWDGPGCFVVEPGESVTVRLPQVPVTEGFVQGVRIAADCNDHYRIAVSMGGESFREIYTAPPVKGWGIQPREVFFGEPKAWTHVRVTPVGGDGSYSIGEITPLVADGVHVDFGTEAARPLLGAGWSGDEGEGETTWVWAVERRARCTLPLQPGTPYYATFVMTPADTAGRPERMVVSLDGTRLGEIDLAAGPLPYHLWVPADLASEEASLELEFDALAPPSRGERRALAASFDHLVLRPLDAAAAWATADR
jgi:hypothetical protein